MIYFDNAATSYPKPSSVLHEGCYALQHASFNSGRGGYRESLRAAEKIYAVREKLGAMFGYAPENIVFTKNCTEALNIAIRGSVQKGDHFIISSLEHNSVSRVAYALQESGYAAYDVASYAPDTEQILTHFKQLIRPNTSTVICMHSSNVFGVSFPIRALSDLCHAHGIRLIVDAAQGAGVADIHGARDGIDILCAPGHKCLLGAMGTGFMAVGEDVALSPFMYGGTGSRSTSLQQPDFLPDRFEAGTLNNAGILSLGSGIAYISSVGRETIYRHELALTDLLYEGLSGLSEIKLYTPAPQKNVSMPIISFNYRDASSEKVAAYLGENGVCVRAGYHCAPLAHHHFKTLERGTVRISVGYFNTAGEIKRFLNILKKF